LFASVVHFGSLFSARISLPKGLRPPGRLGQLATTSPVGANPSGCGRVLPSSAVVRQNSSRIWNEQDTERHVTLSHQRESDRNEFL